ncbi:putative cysteine synthase [Phaeomoniella chlamydospora]|uniref:Putative cysteine synthase n=1 Tax=Phaeomoniella chlamydospora TaxID=158046 RepID=A0A0G2E9R6_PHACM|nr:putative cysteine synthase [Phaeomoniella chlamydospora]
MMTMLPANNVKALPALNLLSESVAPGKTKTVIEYSSGSTVISMSLVSRVVHGITDIRAFLSNKTSDAKLKLMQFFGLDLTLFGGPSQPDPMDNRGGIQAARKQAAESEQVVNPNQYENEANWNAHMKWTGPQIHRQLPHIGVICAGMGTSGTMTGIGLYFKEKKSSVVRIGVCTSPGDRVPGPRSYALMSPVTFPWRDAVDHMEQVGSTESYGLSLQLSREGLICGPSSGFNLQGLYQYIEKELALGTLDGLKNDDGEIHCVFLCCDLPYQYIDEYFTKLDEKNFHPIKNHHLTTVDLYRYDEAWELPIETAFSMFMNFNGDLGHTKASIGTSIQPPLQAIAVLDLRSHQDYQSWHMPGSVNVPFESITTISKSPFFDSKVLEQQWREMESFFASQIRQCTIDGVDSLLPKKIQLICYNGDSSRVATSILRAKGVEASSIAGGIANVKNWWDGIQAHLLVASCAVQETSVDHMHLVRVSVEQTQ